jgi:glutathione synthase/RimK-type ligase-like ATP-grasp enzyme
MTVKLFWFWPGRDRPYEAAEHEEEVWQWYRKAAAAVGFEMHVLDVDDVVLKFDGGRTRVFVRGFGEVQPESTAFHTKVLTWPDYDKDIWRFLSTFAVLERGGFYTTIPVMHSVIDDDKLLTVQQPWAAGLPTVPTTRLSTRHFVVLDDFVDPDTITYPVLVKPSSWGGGMGVLRADSRPVLEAALQLAASSEIPMVLQPWVPDLVADCRVYCIGERPVRAMMRRAQGASFASNVFQGGSSQLIDVPDQLVGPATAVAEGIGLPYVCVDFLLTEDGFFLSEVEMDGTLEHHGTPEHCAGINDLTMMRFDSLREHFHRWAVAAGLDDSDPA